MASPLKFRSLAHISGPGEIIGDTVVLDLKNDVEKLSEEKEALKLLHGDSVKKCDELMEKLEEAEIRYKEIITSKEKMLEDFVEKEKNALAKQNRLKSEFGKQLAHVDSEIKILTNNLEKRGKELETCKKEYVELKVKNREMANNSAAMLCEKSQLLQRVDNLESVAKDKEEKLKKSREMADILNKKIEDAEQKNVSFEDEVLELKSALTGLNSELERIIKMQAETASKNKILCDCIEENEEKMKCFKTEIEQKNKDIQIASDKLELREKEMSIELAVARKEAENFGIDTANLKANMSKAETTCKRLLEEKTKIEEEKTKADHERRLILTEKDSQIKQYEIVIKTQKVELETKITELQKQINEMTEEREHCSIELSKMRSLNDSLNEQCTELLSIKQNFQNQVEQLKIKIESQKNELQEQASIVSMKSNEIEQGNEKLEEAIANNSAESTRLKKCTEDLSKQIETVKEDLRQKTFENEKFAEENQKLKTDLKLHKQETEALLTEKLSLKEEEKNLVFQIEGCEKRIEILTERIEENTKENKVRVDGLLAQIGGKELELKEQSLQNQTKSIESKELRDSVTQHKNDACELKKQYESIKKEKEMVLEENAALQIQVKEMQDCLEQQKGELMANKTEIECLKNDLCAISSLKERYELENSEMKSINNKNEQEIQQLQDDNRTVVKDRNEQIALKNTGDQKIGNLMQTIESQRSEVERCKTESSAINDKLIEKEKHLTELNQARSELLIKNDEIGNTLLENENEIRNLNMMINTKEKLIEDLNQKYESDVMIFSSQLADAKKCNTELSEQIEKTQKCTEILSREDDAIRKEMVQLKNEHSDRLAAQKQKFEGKLKDIASLANKQYKENLEKGLSQLNKNIESRDKTIGQIENENKAIKGQIKELEAVANKYEIAKIKLKDMLEMVEQEQRDRKLTEEKYQASKETIKTLYEANIKVKKELNHATSHGTYTDLQNDNDSLRCQLKQLTSENRSLKVQVTHATTQIRELQSDQHQMAGGSRRTSNANFVHGPSFVSSLDRRQTLAGMQTKATKNLEEDTRESEKDVFKMPSDKRLPLLQNTPGRAKTGRTQSEAALARRPPMGSGSMFLTDDEAGEMFSSSYLSDMKDGKCNPFDTSSISNNSGFDRRLSELSRRNTMVPAHLKSSYPAETQFINPKEFKDADLKCGRLTNIIPSDKDSNDLIDITNKASRLSVDSPAMNTRNKRKPIAFEVSFKTGGDINPKTPSTPALTLEEALNDHMVNAALEEKKVVTKGTKRPSSGSVMSSQSSAMNDSRDSCTGVNKSCSSNFSVKRAKKDALTVSYSRPGPPTPARSKINKSICSNTSIDSVGYLDQSGLSIENKLAASGVPPSAVSCFL